MQGSCLHCVIHWQHISQEKDPHSTSTCIQSIMPNIIHLGVCPHKDILTYPFLSYFILYYPIITVHTNQFLVTTGYIFWIWKDMFWIYQDIFLGYSLATFNFCINISWYVICILFYPSWSRIQFSYLNVYPIVSR